MTNLQGLYSVAVYLTARDMQSYIIIEDGMLSFEYKNDDDDVTFMASLDDDDDLDHAAEQLLSELGDVFPDIAAARRGGP